MGPTTRARLRRAVRDGEVTHLRHDRYALADLPEQKARAIAAGGYLSHLSAAMHWGWKVKHPPRLTCVTLPRGSHRPTGPLRVSWAKVTDAEVHDHVTRRARTVVDCARVYPFDEALAVADSALREGFVDRHELLLVATHSPRTGRSKALRVVEAADARAANPFESVLRAIAMEVPHLHVEPQGTVPGVGRVDLLDRRLGLAIEAESFEFHSTRASLSRDVRRYTGCTRQGLFVARFTWEETMFDPDYVHDALVDAVHWCLSRPVSA